MPPVTRDNHSGWNWKPAEPVENNPLFSWPVNWQKVKTWYINAWLPLSEYSIFIVLALLSWWFLHRQPVTSTALEWIGIIYARNLLYMLVVAGGLHLYFFTYRGQGRDLKYDEKWQLQGRRFTFGHQLYDNMFWSLVSGVTLWTAYEVLLIWCQAENFAPRSTIQGEYWHDGWLWFCLLFLLIPIWISLHFYCVHRALHWPPFYKAFHALHHRNINTGPWSGISMHPVEHLVYFSSVLIHLVIPSHPIHIFFHLYALTLSAVFGHTNFEYLVVKGKKIMAIGHFHHQLHHRYFEVNYGAAELPCDEWFDSFDNGTEQARQKLRHRTLHS